MTQLASLQSPSPAIAEYLTKIDDSARTLLGIINNVLDFSKIEAGSMPIESVSFRWADVVDALTSMVVGLKRAHVEFQMELDPAIPAYLLGDRMRLQQILINLLGNAFKFTENGNVSVHASIADRQPQSILLEVKIADTGIGISQDQLRLLFSPFTQADSSMARRYGGTGLGLAICKRLAEMMGGSITVDSELGRGTCFALRVPLAIATEAPARPKALDLIARHSERLRGVRVLVAEDQRLNQEVICGLLRAFGMEITVAIDGAGAIRHVADTRFDIVLMDIQMPGIDGLEATRIIRETHDRHSLPIIAMTADAFSDVREQCYAAGMNDHVSKPFELEQLIHVIGHWTGRLRTSGEHSANIDIEHGSGRSQN